ncbi:MAG: hypothetical protein IPK80_21920 [Nannocystis sp.]|jgi:hypothetical protein|nr:hypothetical protein [Nannocystis sp.]
MKAKFSAARWCAGAIFDNWGAKATALVLASIFFIVSRDDVTRAFNVPLRVTPDPDRVLLTDLPDAVAVELHGPWARINRLSAKDFGVVNLDLRSASPGPLEIEPSSIVMPQGVLFRNIVYDRVDLRFDPVIERDFPVKPEVQIEVHADYEQVSTLVRPPRIRVRGGRTALQEISSLRTETIERTGVSESVEVTKSVLLPREGVAFVGVPAGERPQVDIRLMIRPKYGERRIDVPLPVDSERFAGIPSTYPVVVRGPLPDLRRFEETASLIVAEVRMEAAPELRPPATAVVVDFKMTDQVPAEVRARLAVEPASRRFIVRPLPQ